MRVAGFVGCWTVHHVLGGGDNSADNRRRGQGFQFPVPPAGWVFASRLLGGGNMMVDRRRGRFDRSLCLRRMTVVLVGRVGVRFPRRLRDRLVQDRSGRFGVRGGVIVGRHMVMIGVGLRNGVGLRRWLGMDGIARRRFHRGRCFVVTLIRDDGLRVMRFCKDFRPMRLGGVQFRRVSILSVTILGVRRRGGIGLGGAGDGMVVRHQQLDAALSLGDRIV